MRRLPRLGLVCCLLLPGCGITDTTATAAPKYLGQFRLEAGATFGGTVIGGLSGLTFDPERSLYYIISDDRSKHNPARFYTARITLSDSGIDNVEFLSTHPWLDGDGAPFPPLDANARPPVVPPDPEGIAFDGRRQRLYWSSEGERDGQALRDPSVRIATLDGGFAGEFTLPPTFRMSVDQTGPRQNRALEGLTLTPSGRYLWAAMEGPLYDDGGPPTENSGPLTRVTRFDVETRMATAQYAYPLDKVSSGERGDNGLSDILALDDENFLAIERGFGTRVSTRLYRVSLGDAEDVLARPSLSGTGVRTMTKTLLADLAGSIDPIDNIEGLTLGPTLPDGRQSLVMVSDDNFSPKQFTQFLAFAL